MSEETGPTAVCTNCDRELPEEKLFLHEAYCIRNIIRCPKCNEPIDKSEKDAHEEEVHRITACKHCKRDMESKLLAQHEETCNAKPKFCQFCNCEVAGEEFSHHTYQCGSRTKKCIFCNKNILVRDYDDHEPVCQVSQQNYGTNFPSMQEEAKADLPKNVAPYSSISSKYVQNPSVNPYDVLTQETKSKHKERPDSKTSSKPTHHAHAREEERKPISSSTSHKLPEHKHTSLTSKPISSNKPEINSYSHSKPYDDKIGLPSHTKPSVPISKTDYTHMRAPETTAYTAQTSSYTKPTVSEPRSYLTEDKHALSNYLTGKHQESGKYISSTSKPDITDPLKSKYTSGYSKPTDLLSNPHGASRTGVPTSSSIHDGSKYGAAGSLGGGITGIKSSITDSTKTSLRTGAPSLGSKIEPTTKPSESRTHKPIFPDKTTTSGTSQRPGIPTSDKYGISNKDITSYSTATSNKPKIDYTKPGLSDPIPKKTTSHTDKYTGISGISGTSGSRPSNQDYRSALSGDHYSKKTENIGGRSTKPTDTTNTHGISGRTEPRSHQTQQQRAAVPSQQSRNVQPSYQDYGHYEQDFGEDPELQRAIQESMGNSKKTVPESRPKQPSSRQPAPVQQNYGYEEFAGGEDDELQKAIQESLKNAHPVAAGNGPNETWNDEAFKRILEQSKREK